MFRLDEKSLWGIVLVYIGCVKMNKAVQIRMPQEMWDHLSVVAEQRAPGTKVTALIREAIHQVYFGGDPDGGSAAKITPIPPTGPYPIPEVTALRAAEEPKKKGSR